MYILNNCNDAMLHDHKGRKGTKADKTVKDKDRVATHKWECEVQVDMLNVEHEERERSKGTTIGQ